MPSANIFPHPAATQQSTTQSSLVPGNSSTKLGDLTALPLVLLNIARHLKLEELSALALSCKPIWECLKPQVIRDQLTFTNPFKPGTHKNQELAALARTPETQSGSKPNENNKSPPTTQINLKNFALETCTAQGLAAWENLETLTLKEYYISSLTQILIALPQIKTLITTDCIGTSALFDPSQIKDHTTLPLQKLVINLTGGIPKNLLSLTVLQKLQHLSFRNELIEISTAIQLHSHLTALKSLNYDNCTFMSGNSLSLSSLTQLTALTLRSITTPANINPANINPATELHALSQLRYLNVSGSLHLFNNPQALPTTLETVNLENTHVTYQTIGALQNLPALSTLRIGNTMNTPNIICLGQLSTLTSLEHLSVQGCDFLSNRMLTDMLRGLTRLIMLNLKALPRITNNGLMHLTFLSNLQRLHIHSCRQISPWWTIYKNFSERHPNFIQRVKMFYIKCQPMRLSDLMGLQTQNPRIQIITRPSKTPNQEPNHHNQPTKKPTKSGIPCETTHILPRLPELATP